MVKVARAEGGEMSLTEAERVDWQQRLAAITGGATAAALPAVEPVKLEPIVKAISDPIAEPKPVFVQAIVPEPRSIPMPRAPVATYSVRSALPTTGRGIVAIGAAPVLPRIADAADRVVQTTAYRWRDRFMTMLT